MSTTTARTATYLEKRGIPSGLVERFVRQAGPMGKRYDLFGFIDVIACYPGAIAGLQITSDGNVSSRVTKILEECPVAAKNFLSSKGVIEVWGWAKKGKAGVRKLWVPRVIGIYLSTSGELYSRQLSDPGLFPRGASPRRRVKLKIPKK